MNCPRSRVNSAYVSFRPFLTPYPHPLPYTLYWEHAISGLLSPPSPLRTYNGNNNLVSWSWPNTVSSLVRDLRKLGRVIILYCEEALAYLAKHVVNEFIERENSCRRSSNSKDKKGQFIFLVNDAFIRMMMSANASLILLFFLFGNDNNLHLQRPGACYIEKCDQ